MFTGLIESLGTFAGASMNGRAGKLRIVSAKNFSDLEKGESIAVNGTCLTLEKFSGRELEFHVMEESFRRTNLGLLVRGMSVNLERAMRVGDRLGGHIVQGHVDGTARILSLGRCGDDTELKAELPEELSVQLVEKGSIAIDGISLTVASCSGNIFTVRIIPTTWNETNLSSRKTGDILNIETDILGKYVAKMLERTSGKRSAITMETLINAGF